MAETVKVSIIVPVYNAEKFLERTIVALCNQSLKEIEIILVDDGSKDKSSQICDMWAEKDQRIRCIHKENGGVSAARNDGIKAAQGEYLMFCDADDIPDEKWAEVLYVNAKENDSDVALCGFTRQFRGEDIPVLFPYEGCMTGYEKIVKKLIMPMSVWGYSPEGETCPGVYGSVCRGIYRASSVDGLCFPTNVKLGEDMIFNALAWSKCNRISFIKESYYYYFENSESATHIGGHIMWDKYLSTWNELHAVLQRISVGEENLSWHNYQLCRYAINAIVEGVCPQNWDFTKKLRMVKMILANSDLQRARKHIPRNLNRKNKIIINGMTQVGSIFLLLYYQRVTNK